MIIETFILYLDGSIFPPPPPPENSLWIIKMILITSLILKFHAHLSGFNKLYNSKPERGGERGEQLNRNYLLDHQLGQGPVMQPGVGVRTPFINLNLK